MPTLRGGDGFARERKTASMARFEPISGFNFLLVFVLLASSSLCAQGRIHHLELQNDRRGQVRLMSFGFHRGGYLEVNLTKFAPLFDKSKFGARTFGFSLYQGRNDGLSSYLDEGSSNCVLRNRGKDPITLLTFNFTKSRVIIQPPVNQTGGNLAIYSQKPGEDLPLNGTSKQKPLNSTKTKSIINKETVGNTELPLLKVNGSYHTQFYVRMDKDEHIGLYTLFFHSCEEGKQSAPSPIPFSMVLDMVERNPYSYLSAGEIPLPRLFFTMGLLFLAAAIMWVYMLRKNRANVFKIHWLMAALVFTKALSLFFHAINYHYIATQGCTIEGWAVVYYITHLLKGALLFITIALVGTGWTFIKHILSDNDKKLFMAVIPLQVLANVAYIVLESTEEGWSEYGLWKEILFLVDLLCCGAILFPVIWSIRHLQEASGTDGKAAMNLAKLKLFRHYYVMIICYIYFTRIIAILIKITIPFQWQWLYECLHEGATLLFFVVTGYKFRPLSDNPYLRLPTDEDDTDEEEILTESGVFSGVKKVNQTAGSDTSYRQDQSMV